MVAAEISREQTVQGKSGGLAETRWDAMSWYLTPVAEERCEPASFTAMKAKTAERVRTDMEALLKLPDDGAPNASRIFAVRSPSPASAWQ